LPWKKKGGTVETEDTGEFEKNKRRGGFSPKIPRGNTEAVEIKSHEGEGGFTEGI